MKAKRQFVSVSISYDEDGPSLDYSRKPGQIIVRTPKIESVYVYGPFDTKSAAEKDASAIRQSGDLAFVAELSPSPENETEG